MLYGPVALVWHRGGGDRVGPRPGRGGRMGGDEAAAGLAIRDGQLVSPKLSGLRVKDSVCLLYQVRAGEEWRADLR